MRVLLVANVLTHYRLPLYEELQQHVDLELIFFSDGQEWYWRQTEQPSGGTLANASWLTGRWLGRTRITPDLLPRVWRSQADIVIKDPTGKFALPVTYMITRLRRKPFVLWTGLWEHPSHGVHRFTRALMRYLYRHSDAVITYGRHVSDYVIAEGAHPDVVFVAPQAVRSVTGPPPAPARWHHPIRLLYVGRLEVWKGLHVLLDALALFGGDARWTLRVAGDGSQAQVLEARTRQLGIADRVHFLGQIRNQSLGTLYESSAVVVVPSIRTPSFSEPWALVVNEAMNAGDLVVASDCVGAVQDGLLRDEHTGLVFGTGDPQSLAQSLAVIMDAASAPRLREIAKAGQEAISSYSFPAAARSFVAAANAGRDSQTTGKLANRL